MPDLEPTTSKSAAVEVASSTPSPQAAYVPPAQPSRDLGMVLIILGVAGTLLSSWTLFSQNSHEEMVAGYWCVFFCVIASLAVAAQRTTLEGFVPAAASAASGIGLVLVGLLHDYSGTVTWTMAVGGIVIALGGLAQGAPKRS